MFFINIDIAERLVGVVFILLAIVLSLPVPFGNLIPGFAISFIAIGLIVHDGLMLAIGLVCGVISFFAMLSAIKAIVTTVINYIPL